MELIDRTTDFIVSNQHLQLVDELTTSKRFKNIKLLNYVDEYDPDIQKQFAAMTYRLSLDTYLVVFRGTDDTLIGWKEDFHMTYMDHVRTVSYTHLDVYKRQIPYMTVPSMNWMFSH